jgi:nucleotidyltransferase-like protein
MDRDVLALCRSISGELLAAGAEAVVLIGSQARGTAAPESDVDLVVIGDGPGYDLTMRSGRLISVSWRAAARQREQFSLPQEAALGVTAWRSALIIADPTGVAGDLQDAARTWSWADLAAPAREWVAAELAGYGEEVRKLVAALRHGRSRVAAVQRNVLATHLAPVLAVHFRLLAGSENDIWDLVAAQAGEPWRSAQDRALGLDGQPLADSCRAALELYAAAVTAAGDVFTERQRPVVAAAVSLARQEA